MNRYERETNDRIEFIREVLNNSGCSGIVYANSGGKDATLTGILCKLACENTVGLILPCASSSNYGSDMEDAFKVAKQFSIETRTVDLTEQRNLFVENLKSAVTLTDTALVNIAPRLRMITLYAVSMSENRLVAGTGNRSEGHMGYFTKWGDGAYDFNPIGDLTVTEIYEFLDYLDAPAHIIKKAPSAGLYEGQTDESEMGISYAAIDKFLLTGEVSEADRQIIDRYHSRSTHKRIPPPVFKRG